jgi:hypothetical protein
MVVSVNGAIRDSTIHSSMCDAEHDDPDTQLECSHNAPMQGIRPMPDGAHRGYSLTRTDR